MICSFTQTYSNNRNELFYYHNKDKTDIYFRNKLDKNYYAFHNSPQAYKEMIMKNNYFNEIKNLDVIIYDNISYTKSFYKTLIKIKEEGFKYILFLQDDAFCLTNKEFVDELLDFLKKNSFNMINIEYSNINNNKNIIYSNKNLKIYNTTSDDFKNKKNEHKNIYMWALDDSPYIANIDFLLQSVYDDIYFNKNDIWNAELYIKEKINKNQIERLTTNISYYERIGLVGPNKGPVNIHREKLNNTFDKLNIAMLMFYDDNSKKFADINFKINSLYCKKYNIKLICSNQKSNNNNRSLHWEKLHMLLKYINDYDYLIWIDSDAFFYYKNKNILELIYENLNSNFIFSNDCGNNKNINTGIFIVKNSVYSIEVLNKWTYDEDIYNYVLNKKRWNDQEGLIYMIDNNILNINQNIKILDYGILQHFFNNDNKLDAFIYHMAGQKNEDRYLVSKKYLEFLHSFKFF